MAQCLGIAQERASTKMETRQRVAERAGHPASAKSCCLHQEAVAKVVGLEFLPEKAVHESSLIF